MAVVWTSIAIIYVFVFGVTHELIRGLSSEWRTNLAAAAWPVLWIALAGVATARLLRRRLERTTLTRVKSPADET